MLAHGEGRSSSLEDPGESLGVHGASTGCQGEESISSMASSKVKDEKNNVYSTFQGLNWILSHT